MWKWLPQTKLQIHLVDMSLNFDPKTLSKWVNFLERLDIIILKQVEVSQVEKKIAKSLPVIIPRKIISMVQYIFASELSIRV